MANWSLPTEDSLYTDVLDFISYRLNDAATGFPTTGTYLNLPNGTIRFNSTISKWEKWSGTAWADLSTTYAISISGTASNVTGTVLAIKGGTGYSAYTIGDILSANSSSTLSKIPAVAVGKVLISNGIATLPTWGTVDLELHTSGILPVSKGGTGTNSITGLVYGNGTNDFSSAANYIDINTTTNLITLVGDLKVSGNTIQSSSGTPIEFNGNDVALAGNLTAAGIMSATSDIRLKTDINTITNALNKTLKLRGVTFKMCDTMQLGVVAQEVEEVIPEVVINGAQYKSVAYGNIVGLLIEAIKELNAKVERLENAG